MKFNLNFFENHNFAIYYLNNDSFSRKGSVSLLFSRKDKYNFHDFMKYTFSYNTKCDVVV